MTGKNPELMIATTLSLRASESSSNRKGASKRYASVDEASRNFEDIWSEEKDSFAKRKGCSLYIRLDIEVENKERNYLFPS